MVGRFGGERCDRGCYFVELVEHEVEICVDVVIEEADLICQVIMLGGGNCLGVTLHRVCLVGRVEEIRGEGPRPWHCAMPGSRDVERYPAVE